MAFCVSIEKRKHWNLQFGSIENIEILFSPKCTAHLTTALVHPSFIHEYNYKLLYLQQFPLAMNSLWPHQRWRKLLWVYQSRGVKIATAVH